MIRIPKVFILLVWMVLLCLPLMLAYWLKKRRARDAIFRLACKGILFIANVRVNVTGIPAAQRPLLMVSNHLSYMDIPILGSVVDARFVPKSEIAAWPVIGRMCTVMEVVFVERRPGKIHAGNDAIRAMLAQEQVVALFPEATTGDGRHMLPFKAAFFEAAEQVAIQPVAIRYRKIGGLPIGYSQWPLVAWYGDMSLLPHLWSFLALGRVDVELVFMPVIHGADGRKVLAKQAHDIIEAALNNEVLMQS